MAYDYSGYGPEADCVPTVSNALADIAAVFAHMQVRARLGWACAAFVSTWDCWRA